ncbi:MAG: hypothetical protein QOG45_128 [Chloroflexota bacterium]|nr:hypothetical protein [Chloroflexota bacterium]
MHEPVHVTRIPTANLYLADGSHLELECDWHRGLGWWRVDDHGRGRLTVVQAFERVSRAVRHEVLIEAQTLATVTMHEWLQEAGDLERHSAVEALIGEIQAAMVALRRCDRGPSTGTIGLATGDRSPSTG